MKKTKNSQKISEVKGRPMLHWVGKQPLDTVTSFPAQLVETFAADNPPVNPTWENLKDNWYNLLFHGDNKEVLSTLLVNGFRGKIDLVYIDPPFDSGADYVRNVKLRGTDKKCEGEEYSIIEQTQYTDIWLNDNYLQFMYERLIIIRELLKDTGAIFLHCDSSKGHFLRCIINEVFGENNFMNEIIWSYRRWPSSSHKFQSMHDSILYYVKRNDNTHIFNKQYEDVSEGYMKRFGGKTQRLDEETGTRKITSEEDTKGMPLRDVWDISIIAGFKGERTSYPTQKPEELVERILKICSEQNSIILDCFIGSGTTAAVAQKLGRRWIGCDINKGAVQTTGKRLQTIVKQQQVEIDKEKQKLPLEKLPKYYLPFCHYRINDYDLQVQHNEFRNLIYEHLGVRKLPSDSFFDGTLGTELVKIVPLNHPLTLMDIQLVKDEFAKRKDEERNIVMVSLGKELAVDEELINYNKLKPINKIRVIELRTDKKYGVFFTHKPAQADVRIERKGDRAKVVIKDFISPTIIQRLNIDAKLFTAQIKDFRSQIDCVLIDNNYDGEVFNIFLSDVPEKKNDLVIGDYKIKIPYNESKIAVKIIDMLGEEILTVN